MIIVTPPAGSVPEPRPQALITGDRAITLLNDSGVSVTALTKAGVQIVTISLGVFNELTTELKAPVSTDVDPATGTIKESLLPTRLSAGAVAALNLLDGTGHVNETFVPTRLSTAALTALIAATNNIASTTDPDGTPVLLSGSPSGTDATFTGTLTAGTANIGAVTATQLTATTATITTTDSVSALFDNQSVAPAAPAATKARLYSDGNSRLNWKTSTGTTFLVGNKRVVSAWPADADSQMGDEAIMTPSGEHRMYAGLGRGWRLVSPHQVNTLADRDAIVAPYEGMRVYCNFGVPQDMVWNNGVWRGTKTFGVGGGPVRSTGAVNDTNFRRWNDTTINDPGYPYYVFGRLTLEVVLQANKSRVEVLVSAANPDGSNFQPFHQSYVDNFPTYGTFCRIDCAPLTPNWMPQTGTRVVMVDWRVQGGNGASAFSGAYQAWNDYLIIPA